MNNQEKREISLYSYETNEKAVREHLEYYLRHLKMSPDRDDYCLYRQ
jgi:hypothetical protein